MRAGGAVCYLSVSFGYTPGVALLAALRFCAGTMEQPSGGEQRLLYGDGVAAEATRKTAGAAGTHRRLRPRADILTQWNGEAIPLAALDEHRHDEDSVSWSVLRSRTARY